MLMKKLMLTLFFSSGIIISFTESALTNSQARQLIDVDCVEFKNYRNEMIEKVQDYEEYKIELEIQRQLEEQERLRQEELERQRLAEIEDNRVVTYNPYNLLEPSNITREEAYIMLEGTALQTLSNAYVYMEELYGVNAIYLMSLSAEESGWGRSQLAITHNNIGGIKSSNGWMYFSDWGECLDYKARLLKNQYLSENGYYFNGYSIWNVNIKYCEQNTWADNINSIAYGLLNKIN